MERWANKVAVVTGAASGIGAAVATELAKNGMVVIGIDLNFENMQKMINNLGKVSGSLHAKKLDITNFEKIPILIKEIKEEFGGIHVMVNNAGVIRDSFPLSECPSKDLLDMMNVNVIALTIFSREAIAVIKELNEPGHIFNINSLAGHKIPLLPGVYVGFYTATKHAVTVINETLRFEMGYQNTKIRVTSICPGLVDTPLYVNSHLNMPQFPTLKPKAIANTLIFALGLPHDVLIQEFKISHSDEPY